MNDLIDRQAAKDAYCRICLDRNICYSTKEHCEDLKVFDALPSVNPNTEEKEELKEAIEAAEKIKSFCSKANDYCTTQDGKFCPALKKGRCQVKEVLSYKWDI